MHLKRGWILLLVILLIMVNFINMGAMYLLTGRAVAISTGQALLCLNYPPEIQNIPNQSIAHNSQFNYSVIVNDTSEQTLTYADNVSLFEINSSIGTINFTPNIDQTGNHSILISVTDSGDCALMTSTSFILNITNSAPRLNQTIPNQTWEEDVSLTGLDLDDYFTEPENDVLTFTVLNGSNIKVTVNNNTHRVIFTPAKDFNGITWVIFIANDTREINQSNNVTLNITPVANFCGDYICNSNEDCSSCAADCGSCPSTGVSPGGGGGGSRSGFHIIEKIIREPANASCYTQSKCLEWAPEGCINTQTQQRSCIVVDKNCQAKEVIQERPCLCQPRWECTIWLPQNCDNGEQQRECLDINQCGVSRPLPLSRSCTPGPTALPEPSTALAGKAFFSERIPQLRQYSVPILIGISTLIVLLLLYLLGKRPKNPPPKTSLPQPTREQLLQKQREILYKIAKKKKNRWSQRFLTIEEKLRKLK